MMVKLPIRILLIDDDPDDRVLLRDLLDEQWFGGFTLEEAPTFEEGKRRLTPCEHDVVLLDYRLGAESGLDLLRYAEQQGCRVPILFLTGQRDATLDEAAIRAGAADFLPKDTLTADALQRAIRHALDRQKSNDALRDLNARLEQRVQDRMSELQFINERLLREIATRERVEAKLRASEEHQRVLVEQVKDYAIFRTDLEGRPTSWNEGVRRVLAYEEREFIGKDVQPEMFLPDDVKAGVPEQELTTAAQQGVASHDRWMRRKDGACFWATGTTTRLLDPAGKLIGYTKVLRDLTDRKLAEDAAMEAGARLRAIVDTAVDGIVTIDGRGIIESINPAALKLFGYSSEDVIGKNVCILMPEPEASEPDRSIEDYLRMSEPNVVGSNREVVAKRSDGTTFLAELAVSETRLDGRRIFTGLVRDITERKVAEAQLHDADRRKNEFLATLAHELRNPLAPIRNGIYMLRMMQDNKEVLESTLSMMEGQIRHMVRLIDDLMDLSRISRSKVQLRKDRIELAWAINEAVEASGPVIEDRKHELIVDLPKEPIFLEADSVRVAQILSNLLNNAAKYTDPGGTIRLSASQELRDDDPSQTLAVVRVSDTGIGIAPEHLPNIFGLFVQVDRASKYAPGGLGIGLSLVRGLVELHGGTVEAFSGGQAKGSEFVVRLPALPPAAPQRLASQTDVMPILQPNACRILVVDDNRDSADSLASVLQAEGHETAVAYHGVEAAKLAETFRPEIALLDIGLPGMTGHELASVIRRLAEGRDVLLVAMTGWGQDEDRRKSLEAGFDAHLVKPVDLADVHALVSSWSPR